MRIRKKYLFYVLGISSAAIGAIVTVIDTFISIKYEMDPWALCLAIFMAGLIITFLLCIILSLPFKGKKIGARIDPSFNGIRLIKRREILYHLMAGIGNAIATISYFLIISLYRDPSATLSFFQIVILYLLFIESIAEKNAPTLAEVQSSVIVTFGAVLASFSLKGEINVIGLLIVFLLLNPSWVIFSIYQRKLKIMKINGAYNDSINIRLWNLVFTTLFTALFVYLIKRDAFYDAFRILNFWHLLFLSMGITFFSYILYIRALGLGKASVTQAVKSLTIIFSIPLTFVLAKIIPITIFESITHAIIKMFGIILVVLGVISFALTEVKAYIFIKVKAGYSTSKLIDKIWKIKGTTSVAAVAGNYDIIAKVRIRTLGKGYERIIRAIEKIKEIESFEWQSILKEWEEI